MPGCTTGCATSAMFSSAALGEVDGSIDLLYIDGAHRFRPALDDIRRWGARVGDGGTLLIHDSFSSIGVTLALLASLFFGDAFRYVGRSGSMTEYRRMHLSPKARVKNAARQAASLPWFVRNVVLKVCITLKLRPLYRLLGSDGTWPYWPTRTWQPIPVSCTLASGQPSSSGSGGQRQ